MRSKTNLTTSPTDMPTTPKEQTEIRIGISSCLLGEKVRFDGGHKRDAFIDKTLSQFVRFVPVCPEVEIGLGTPRESLRLVRVDKNVRMLANKSGNDYTTKMKRYAKRRVHELQTDDLCGYLFKKDSPSCGVYTACVCTPKMAYLRETDVGCSPKASSPSTPNYQLRRKVACMIRVYAKTSLSRCSPIDD